MPKIYTRRSRSNYNAIKELRINNNVAAAVKLVKRMSKQVNQKLYRLEKAGVSGSSIGYKNAGKITGTDKPRFSTSENVLSRMQPDDLFSLAYQLNDINITKDTTVTGYREVEHNRISAGVESLQKRFNIDINETEFKQFLEIGGAEFLNSKHLDSAQIIEDFIEFTKNGNLSGAEFLREFKRYRKQMGKLEEGQQFDYAKVRRNLVNLQARKSKRK